MLHASLRYAHGRDLIETALAAAGLAIASSSASCCAPRAAHLSPAGRSSRQRDVDGAVSCVHRQAMNYRHAYHAGNPADVIKHAVLAFVLSHMVQKDKPLRVIDTHAGLGRYDLTADASERTGEWVEGIGRLWARTCPSRSRRCSTPISTPSP